MRDGSAALFCAVVSTEGKLHEVSSFMLKFCNVGSWKYYIFYYLFKAKIRTSWNTITIYWSKIRIFLFVFLDQNAALYGKMEFWMKNMTIEENITFWGKLDFLEKEKGKKIRLSRER